MKITLAATALLLALYAGPLTTADTPTAAPSRPGIEDQSGELARLLDLLRLLQLERDVRRERQQAKPPWPEPCRIEEKAPGLLGCREGTS